VTTQAKVFRDLLNRREPFVAADVYSALTGKIVESVGFKAAYLGGHACSAFHYAMPDYGMFTQVEQIEQAQRIADVINIPLVADADTLGETIAEAYHFTRRYIRAGIAAIHVEDQVNPKHSTYVNGLTPIPDMQARIEACVKARRDSDIVIIARCDEFYDTGGHTMEEAYKRGKAYAEAGADSLVFPMIPVENGTELAKQIPIPFSVLGSNFPGAACHLHSGWGAMSAAKLHLMLCRELFETGAIKFDGPVSPLSPADGKARFLEQDLYDELIADWAKKTGRPTRPRP
jgi:2-methylisocitrate lyase-like PEP mutase family enzyme